MNSFKNNRRKRKGKPDLVQAGGMLFVTAGLLLAAWSSDGVDWALDLIGSDAVAAGEFSRCKGSGRYTCVVDGDTFWYEGEKIRIADIDAPEIFSPDCREEEALGQKATDRLQTLLNEGGFTLELPSSGRDTDIYGRSLRVVMQNDHSIGDVLIAEGLAAAWGGRRENWCARLLRK